MELPRGKKRRAAEADANSQLVFNEAVGLYDQMRGWRHDWRNHIQALQTQAAAGDMAGIQSYLAALAGDLSVAGGAVRTGNSAMDAILNAKYRQAAEKGIAVDLTARIPAALSTPGPTLCVILGNLFDNAIEAAAPLPEDARQIRVYMDMKGSWLYICFTNLSAGKKLPKVAGRFASTKGAGRGLGLKRIDAAVAAAGGWLARNSEDGAFTTEMMLPQ